MGRIVDQLTALEVTNLRTPGRHIDGNGLYLAIDGTGRKRWVFLFTLKGRKRREMGLGAADKLTLAQAREEAAKQQALVKRAIDPIVERNRVAAAEAAERLKDQTALLTFGVFADRYIKAHAAEWKNPTHLAQWRMTLTRYCNPIRQRPICDIDTNAVMSVLKPLWHRVPETAQRLRGRIERVLDAAKAEGFRAGENPAAWRGHLKHLLPRRQKLTRGHHAALPYERVGDFMGELRERDAVAARALELCVLTAARTSEVVKCEWTEIDLKKALWIVPAARMKTGREHRVPLSTRAVTILNELAKAKQGRFVFSIRGTSPLSNMAMSNTMQRMGYGDFTVHGFRSTFRDWVEETTTTPHAVAEMALAHTIKNESEAAYRRRDVLEKRRALAETWSNYCERGPAEVVHLAVA